MYFRRDDNIKPVFSFSFISVGMRRGWNVGIELPQHVNLSPAFSQGCQFEEHVGCDPFVPFGREKNVLGIKIVY